MNHSVSAPLRLRPELNAVRGTRSVTARTFGTMRDHRTFGPLGFPSSVHTRDGTGDPNRLLMHWHRAGDASLVSS
jgi:hypothetical protein